MYDSNQNVSIRNLINRLEMDAIFLEKHPENRDMIKRHIERTKEYIIQCVLQHKNDPVFERMTLDTKENRHAFD